MICLKTKVEKKKTITKIFKCVSFLNWSSLSNCWNGCHSLKQQLMDWSSLIYLSQAKWSQTNAIFFYFNSLIKNSLIRASYWKGAINILLQGRNSPQYVMYKAELVSSQFKSLRILFNASLLIFFYKKQTGPISMPNS